MLHHCTSAGANYSGRNAYKRMDMHEFFISTSAYSQFGKGMFYGVLGNAQQKIIN